MIRHEFFFSQFYDGFGYKQVYFDLTDREGNNVKLTAAGVEGLGEPEYEWVTRQTRRSGQKYEGWRALPRDVFLPVVVDARAGDTEDWMALQTRLWESQRPADVRGFRQTRWRVTAPDGSWRELFVRFVSDNAPAIRQDPSQSRREVHGLSMVADDPFWYGPPTVQQFQTPATPVDFFGPGPGAPMFNIMPANTLEAFTVTALGDLDLPILPKWRINGETSGFALYRTEGGFDSLVFSTDVDVPAGGYLEIDLDPYVQTAILEDPDTGPSNVGWDVQYGNQLEIYAKSTAEFRLELNGPGSAQLEYRPRYFRGY